MHTHRARVAIAAIAVCLVAAGVRFARLGTWSFASDEVASILEANSLLGGQPVSDDPITRLPRMTPLGVVAHGLSFQTFGRDEFAARLPAAIAGVLLCGLAVVALWPALGGWVATATGLLIAINHEFVYYSQYNRYYSLGSLLTGGCILAGLAAVRRRSVGWMAVAAVLATAAMSNHLLSVGLFPGLIASALLAPAMSWRDRARLAAIVIIIGCGVAVVGVLYLAPLAQGWNAGVDWGYSIPHAIAGGINQLGVPTALLGALGAVLLLAGRHPLRWFWAVWAGGWVASLIVFPRVLAFHPGYSFLYLFGPVVLAGYAVGQIAEKLTAAGPGVVRGSLTAAVWVGVAALLDAPALVSHFMDGSRYDFRAGAQFVADHHQTGDTIAAVSVGNFSYYNPEFASARRLNPDRLMEGFRDVAAANRRCWVVVVGNRAPRHPDAQTWLNENCRLKASIRKTRFDYYDYLVEVYEFQPK